MKVLQKMRFQTALSGHSEIISFKFVLKSLPLPLYLCRTILFHMKTDFLLYTSLLILTACGSETPNNTGVPPASSSQAAPATPDDRPIVYLEGLYATSSTLGREVFDLFDNDPATGWQTRLGAGPDEGIMLYFSNALPLGAVRVTAGESSYHGDGNFVLTYVNGAPGKSGKPGDTIALGDKPVKALYLRFIKTGMEQSVTRQKGDAEVVLESFPQDASVVIKELTVFNDKGKPMRLMPPKRIHGTITASSTLAPESAYSPSNLFDARKEFVWVEGNKDKSGEDEVITFEFMEEVNMSALQIWDGYQRSDEHFAANARVRDFEFGLKDGPKATYTLRDTKAGQKIDLQTALKGRVFELKIKSIYPGRNYKDLAISEMLFFDGEKPFTLATELSRQYVGELHRKTVTTPLAKILDRRISNVVEEADVLTHQSLILRSDGTFVMYSSNKLPTDTESQTLADGNWELLRADGAGAVLKVFGKWNNVSDFVELYQGKTTRDITRIFSDELTVDANTIKGKKMIETFYVR